MESADTLALDTWRQRPRLLKVGENAARMVNSLFFSNGLRHRRLPRHGVRSRCAGWQANRVFAVDARHVYAMTDTGPLLIEDIEPGEVQPAGLYSVRVGGTQLHVYGGIGRRLRPEDASG